jgi:hypothetical protein
MRRRDEFLGIGSLLVFKPGPMVSTGILRKRRPSTSHRRHPGHALLCGAANLTARCPLWVISVFSKRGTDVGFTPNSDRSLRRREMTLCAISDQSAPQQICRVSAQTEKAASRRPFDFR